MGHYYTPVAKDGEFRITSEAMRISAPSQLAHAFGDSSKMQNESGCGKQQTNLSPLEHWDRVSQHCLSRAFDSPGQLLDLSLRKITSGSSLSYSSSNGLLRTQTDRYMGQMAGTQKVTESVYIIYHLQGQHLGFSSCAAYGMQRGTIPLVRNTPSPLGKGVFLSHA